MAAEPPSPAPATSTRQRLSSAWPHLRVLFIAFHVLAVSIAALPSTGSALKRSAWQDPTVQAEFTAWAPRLGLTVPALSDQLWTFARAWNSAQTTISAPFTPYLRFVHATQSWQMFVAPHTFPTRLQLQERRKDDPDNAGAESPKTWETLYEEGSDSAVWRVEMLRVERFRASIFRWGWPSYAGAFRSACHALANLRFAEDPDVTGFRCRFSKSRTPSVAEVRANKVPPSEWLDPVEVER